MSFNTGFVKRFKALAGSSALWLPAILICVSLLENISAGNIDEILDGVGAVSAQGTNSPVCVFGDNAFPVLAGTVSSSPVPVVGAALSGTGRIVASGDVGLTSASRLSSMDTDIFMRNIIDWLGASNADPVIGVYEQTEFYSFLSDNGYTVVQLEQSNWKDSLSGLDILVMNIWDQTEQEIETIRSFVHNGKGLYTAVKGWVWTFYGPEGRTDISSDYPGNWLLAPEGMAVMGGYNYLSGTSDNVYDVSLPPDPFLHAGWSVDSLLTYDQGSTSLSADQIDYAMWIVTKALEMTPADDPYLVGNLISLGYDKIPSPSDPVDNSDIKDKLYWAGYTVKAGKMPVDSITGSAAADAFPGSAGSGASAVSKTISIDTEIPDWHSTGLYARAGETVTVTVPASVVDLGLKLQIGSHTENLWSKESWLRCPDVTRRFDIKSGSVDAASAFGGLVYIVVPNGLESQVVDVTVSGAVEAPYFKLGETDPAQWTLIRERDVPWAEIEVDGFIMTLPADSLRDLDNIQEVAQWWQNIMYGYAELLSWSWENRRSERMVLDVDITHGWLHAGYPIAGFVVQTGSNIEMEELRYGNWGTYHELGHNFQRSWWTWDGCVEITNNVQILYLYDTVSDTDYHDVGADNNYTQNRDEKLAEWFAQGSRNGDGSFADVGPFTGLLFFIELQEAFGWDVFKQIFADYEAADENDLPTNNQEKQDQWCVRFSEITGYDISPQCEAWGIHISDEAKSQIAGLTPWMHSEVQAYTGIVKNTDLTPADIKMKLEITKRGRKVIINLPGKADNSRVSVYSLDGRLIDEITGLNKNRFVWNIQESLSSGVYLIGIYHSKASRVEKITLH